MIEKVARAICPDDFNNPNNHKEGECEYCDSQRNMTRAQAKRAIAAMREPTEEMLERVSNADGYLKENCTTGIFVYECMIDAALKE